MSVASICIFSLSSPHRLCPSCSTYHLFMQLIILHVRNSTTLYSHFRFMQDVQSGALQDYSSLPGHKTVLITDSTNWAPVKFQQPSN